MIILQSAIFGILGIIIFESSAALLVIKRPRKRQWAQWSVGFPYNAIPTRHDECI